MQLRELREADRYQGVSVRLAVIRFAVTVQHHSGGLSVRRAELRLPVGVFGPLVAERERRKGSAWWTWVVPRIFGVLLIVVGLVRLAWVT